MALLGNHLRLTLGFGDETTLIKVQRDSEIDKPVTACLRSVVPLESECRPILLTVGCRTVGMQPM